MKKAIFLDRDGTINRDVNFLIDFKDFELIEGSLEALKILQDLDYHLFIVSNQSGIARGYLDEARLAEIHARLTELLLERGVRIAGIYYCPHLPEGTVARYAVECDCRKPKPGLILQAAREHGIDLSASYIVGDRLRDVEAGRAAGCRSILIGEGKQEWSATATSLEEAAKVILRATHPPAPG